MRNGGVRDVIVLGAGHNGLVTAACLAKAGLRTLVLERREVVGGAAVTEEIHPGFRVPAVAHAAGSFRADVARALDLARHGVGGVRPGVRLVAPAADAPPLVIYEDTLRSVEALRSISASDAEAYGRFTASLDAMLPLVRDVTSSPPPPLDAPGAADLLALLKLGRRFAALDRRDAYRLLRWVPMPVADLMSEWFESDRLRAALGAQGIVGAFAGPWSAGTGANFLFQMAAAREGAVPPFPTGGAGAVSEAIAAAARAAGAEIRTGAEVRQIVVRNGRATGVVLAAGEEIPAAVIASNADPKRTFLQLVDPADLDPGFRLKIRNLRSDGIAAKVNLALEALPSFTFLDSLDEAGSRELLRGIIRIAPGIDYLERAFDAAKYGAISPAPFLDVAIPSIDDPSLAPPGRHVMSIHVQFAPYRLRDGDWTRERTALGDRVLETLAVHAPDLRERIVTAQVVTPLDLEQIYGLTGGHGWHGESSLNQLFTMRPVLGWARYRTPIAGLYLCGSGTHPGGGLTGGPGLLAARQILRDWKSKALSGSGAGRQASTARR